MSGPVKYFWAPESYVWWSYCLLENQRGGADWYEQSRLLRLSGIGRVELVWRHMPSAI
ncbi:hypothetical protein DY000_02017906 [Brassica cretica]|uniref:Uncharacterized protein n=1 Tax=Brassica cretica TaxID=69181 RepID=A0ABQ7CN39_BRACR|nr:hypothetical protein DY000_02017906 [Brassica cretica]